MYNKNEVLKAIEQCKKFNVTTIKKAMHHTKAYEVQKMLNELMNINRYLFDSQFFYYYIEYKKAIEQKVTKKDLDFKLKRCIGMIQKELHSILNLLDTCTYDEKQGKYIEN